MRQLAYLLMVITLILSACEVLPEAPTPTPTRTFSGPTLQPSPTVAIRSSDELYAASTPAGSSDPTIAALPNEAFLPPVASGTREASGAELVRVVMDDGSLLLADFYHEGTARQPGVLLLGPDRLAWGLLPVQLQGAGFAVLSVDMRATPRTADLEPLLSALMESGAVDPGRIAVMGAAQGADIALLGCANLPACDAVALLSPLGRDSLLNAMITYNPRPLLVAVGRDDREAYAAGLAITNVAQGETRFLEFETGRGTALLRLNPTLSDELVGWLASVLQ